MVIVTMDSEVNGRYWEKFGTEEAGHSWVREQVLICGDKPEYFKVYRVHLV
jgi:hypothetical protein